MRFQNARVQSGAISTVVTLAATSSPSVHTKRDVPDDILNATLWFQKIFIINLAPRTDRRDAAALAAAITGVKIEFINASICVDVKDRQPGWKEVGFMKPGRCWQLAFSPRRNRKVHLVLTSAITVVSSAPNNPIMGQPEFRIEEQNIQSTLILEDDADWDIRIKLHMRDFAKASRLLVQSISNTGDKVLDPTWPQPDSQNENPTSFSIDEATSETVLR